MRQVVKILPKRALYRVNLALYADYSGDFQTAEQEARAMPQPGVFGTLALAFSQLLQGQLPQAAETYQAPAARSTRRAPPTRRRVWAISRCTKGVSRTPSRILTDGAAADVASKDSDRAASKFVALAYAQL